LNEREMCRLLGGGTPGCCQCACQGPSSKSSNDSANNKSGYTSDPGSHPCCDTTTPEPPPVYLGWQECYGGLVNKVDNCKP
jgi:hypothetical protein